MKQKLVVNWVDDETMSIRLNDVLIGRYNYDEHGRTGMEAAEQVATDIALMLGIEVVDTFDGEDD